MREGVAAVSGGVLRVLLCCGDIAGAVLLEMCAGQLMRCWNEQLWRFHFKHLADDGLQLIVVIDHDETPC